MSDPSARSLTTIGSPPPPAELLRTLAARARPTGSPAAEQARTFGGQVLTELGFRLIERPFTYSAFVGDYGTPVGGLIALGTLLVGRAAALGGHGGGAIAVLLVGIAILVSGGWWLARKGILALPLMRRRGVNLEARRSGADPVLWLVAHVDSKSQPVPLLVRAGGIVLLAVACVFAIVLAIAAISGRGSPGEWLVVAVLATIGALPVLGSVVGQRSAGALDNASGLATVLTAASMLPRELPIGVLITDAEELGLAGARAWCSEFRDRSGIVLNCDGVDDDGDLTLMWTRPRTSLVESAMRAAAAETGVPLRVIPLVPGVLVDGVAFSDAGWQSVTLSRGTLRTLRRIHTSADNLEHLRGDGITAAARVLARAAAILTERR